MAARLLPPRCPKAFEVSTTVPFCWAPEVGEADRSAVEIGERHRAVRASALELRGEVADRQAWDRRADEECGRIRDGQAGLGGAERHGGEGQHDRGAHHREDGDGDLPEAERPDADPDPCAVDGLADAR